MRVNRYPITVGDLKVFFTLFCLPHNSMCLFVVVMPSIRIHNVNCHENKENTLNEKVSPNFWSVLYLPILAISGQTSVELQLFRVRPRPFLVFIAPPFGGIVRNLTHMVCDDTGTSVPSFMMIHVRGMKL